MILAAFVQVMSYAAIVLDEPVIGNDYMKFSGQCAEHNWKFVLDTYEWADKGPQFQLTITPMDVAQDAYFTSDDLADENYWEPMFRKYTKQMAGQEMEKSISGLYDVYSMTPEQIAEYQRLVEIKESLGSYVFSYIAEMAFLFMMLFGMLKGTERLVHKIFGI